MTMKNNRFILQHSNLRYLLLFFILLAQGVYAWEGAGAVSTDLPDTGKYIATNSFPANTLVLLTNLETGANVEVKVYSRLTEPGGGLLAEVSREAASAIGLQSRSIGRIRLTALSDPAVVSRLSDDRLRSGDPDYDPQAKLKEAYGDEYPYKNGTVAAAPPVAPAPITPPAESIPNNNRRNNPDSAWPPAPETPIAIIRVPEPEPPAPPVVVEPEPPAPVIEEPPPPVIVVVPEPPAPPVVVEPEPPAPVIEEPPPPAIVVVPEPPAPVIVEPPPPPPVVVREPEPPIVVTPPEDRNPASVIFLVPADEAPPAYTPPVPAAPPPPAPAASGFSTVTRLERDKQYIQVGAFNQKTAVEDEIAKLKGYPLTILCVGSPTYRVLVGPVNRGEAGIMLKKLQSAGYKNAFLRKGE